MADDPITVCEVCGEPVERVFYPVAVHFKGSGFYATDYGRARGGGGGDSARTRAPRRVRRRAPKETATSKTDSSSGSSSSSGLLGFRLVRLVERLRLEHEVRLTRILCVAAAALILGAGDAHAESIGPSVHGRPIDVHVDGASDAAFRVLVVGSIHGNETAGHAVIRRLRALGPPGGMRIWTIRTVNPDGVVAGTRENARGIDLNRNFPHRWRAPATRAPGRSQSRSRGRCAGSCAASART